MLGCPCSNYFFLVSSFYISCFWLCVLYCKLSTVSFAYRVKLFCRIASYCTGGASSWTCCEEFRVTTSYRLSNRRSDQRQRTGILVMMSLTTLHRHPTGPRTSWSILSDHKNRVRGHGKRRRVVTGTRWVKRLRSSRIVRRRKMLKTPARLRSTAVRRHVINHRRPRVNRLLQIRRQRLMPVIILAIIGQTVIIETKERRTRRSKPGSKSTPRTANLLRLQQRLDLLVLQTCSNQTLRRRSPLHRSRPWVGYGVTVTCRRIIRHYDMSVSRRSESRKRF